MTSVIQLNPSLPEPVFQQIADRIREQVFGGSLRPGDALTPVRDLARALGVNQNTVQRAYGLLRANGVIEGRSGAGTRIRASLNQESVAYLRSAELNLMFKRAVGEAGARGYSPAEIAAASAAALRSPLAAAASLEYQWIGLGSHDLSLEQLFAQTQVAHPGCSFSFAPVGSMAGLLALARGDVHFATAHLLDPASGEYNLAAVRATLPGQAMTLLTVALRSQGLIVARGNPKRLQRVRDLARRGVRMINRQTGAGTRVLLDRELALAGLTAAQLKGYANEAKTHVGVTSAILRGEADAGLGIEAAARAAGLDFVALASERFELVIPSRENVLITRLRDALSTTTFKTAIAQLGGYDTQPSGMSRAAL